MPVPKLPGVVRDLSFLVDRSVTYGEIARVLGRLDQPLLEGFELVDRFSGAPVPADKVSLTIRLRFRHPQRTLVAGEVDRAEQEIVGHLRSALAYPTQGGEKLTSELERIKILEGKIGQVVDHIHKLTTENEKLRQQLKEFRTEKKDFEESTRKIARMDEEMKKYEGERELLKGKIEAIIGEIDKLGL